MNEFTLIPSGVFKMGSSENEMGRWGDEGPVHEVKVPRFYLGRHSVTNEEYGRYLSANPMEREPRYWNDRRYNQPCQPVVGVSWNEARRYAEWVGCRLPTEAEWEYACRAGTGTCYYGGNNRTVLDRYGWYFGNSGNELHCIGKKNPNKFGLYDMHGNVWEWVEDNYHYGYEGAPSDGQAWVDNHQSFDRVLRGGSWNLPEDHCRSAFRLNNNPDYRYYYYGFRIAKDFVWI